MSSLKIQKVQWEKLGAEARAQLLKRPVSDTKRELTIRVREIVDSVRQNGDSAVLSLTRQYDRVELNSLRVTPEEMEFAENRVKPEIKSALRESIRRITLFHKAQLPNAIDLETSPGVRCQRRHMPIRQVGLYIPAGTAPLPSTVIMLGVPSMIAGCERRVLVTPPSSVIGSANGSAFGTVAGMVDSTVLVTAKMLGITEIYKAGGAQAVAALAYGTETIQKVDKIFGPGNSWVTEAKLQVAQDPNGAACDLPAGPSEVMVIADENANPAFVASDLLSQAEHGVDSQVILVSNSEAMLEQVMAQVGAQLQDLPRKEIITEALSKSLFIFVSNIRDAFPICNEYAPEHLILQLDQPRSYLDQVRNAGSVFLGPWTPESAGDYASGTNHVLPTYGFARAYGGLTTESFMKSMTIQELTPAGLKVLGPVVETIAETEMLLAHRNAVRVRLDELGKNKEDI